MIISLSKRFLFVHIPKTAGTSLSSVLSPYRSFKADSFYCRAKRCLHDNRFVQKISGFELSYDEFSFYNHTHLTAAAAQKIIPPEIFSTLFKFAVVRHPVDWQYSMYRHILAKHRNSQYRHLFEPVFKHETFSDYIKWRVDTHFIAPQLLQVVNPSGNLIVDKVYRFESLTTAFEDVCKRLDVSADLPLANKGKSIRETIDDKTKDLIVEKFSVDFEAFGYSPESTNEHWTFKRDETSFDLAHFFRDLSIENEKFSLWGHAEPRKQIAYASRQRP